MSVRTRCLVVRNGRILDVQGTGIVESAAVPCRIFGKFTLVHRQGRFRVDRDTAAVLCGRIGRDLASGQGQVPLVPDAAAVRRAVAGDRCRIDRCSTVDIDTAAFLCQVSRDFRTVHGEFFF